MYKKILIATDGSEQSRKAETHGLELAKFLNAEVIFVTATPPIHSGMIGGPMIMMPDAEERAVDFAKANLKAVAEEANRLGVAHDTVHVMNKYPYEGIIDTAKDRNCDLIVMASHGWRGLSALLLGSEAQKVPTHSKVPVLIHQ